MQFILNSDSFSCSIFLCVVLMELQLIQCRLSIYPCGYLFHEIPGSILLALWLCPINSNLICFSKHCCLGWDRKIEGTWKRWKNIYKNFMKLKNFFYLSGSTTIKKFVCACPSFIWENSQISLFLYREVNP